MLANKNPVSKRKLDQVWNNFLECGYIVREKIIVFIAVVALLVGAVFAFANPARSESHYLADGKSADFMDLVALAQVAGADRLILRDSEIGFSLGYSAPMPVTIQGIVIFVMPGGMPGPGEYTLLSDVYLLGRVFPQTGFSQMFDTEILFRDESLILSVSRITDYDRVLGGAEGRFINGMRASGANPELTLRLDGANTMAELKSIMDKSVALRPSNLMNPVRLLLRFGPSLHNEGVAGDASVMFGDGLVLYSGNFGAFVAKDGLSFGAYVRVGEFSNSGIEEYSGLFYGFGIRGRLDREIFYAVAAGGVTFADFQTGPVHDGKGDAVYNPKGMALHGNVEVGAKAFDDGRFHIVPIVRADRFAARVLFDSTTDISVGIGARAGYRTVNMGIESLYGIYGIAREDGGQFGIRKDIRSPHDGMTVNLDAAVLDMDLGRFYKVGAGVKLDF